LKSGNVIKFDLSEIENSVVLFIPSGTRFLVIVVFVMSGKRIDLSIQEKRDILKRYDGLKKCSQRQAASILGVSQPLLCKMLKDRYYIESNKEFNLPITRKRLRSGKCVKVEEGLLRWFVQAKTSDVMVTNADLFDKASSIATQLGVEDFIPTDGWLSRWKSRNNIVPHKNVENKKGVINDESFDKYVQFFSANNIKSENDGPDEYINKPIAKQTLAAMETLRINIQHFGNEDTFRIFNELLQNIDKQLKNSYVSKL